MSRLLERALSKYRHQKKEKEKLAARQKVRLEAEASALDVEFNSKVLPIIQRYWQENAPSELIELFDEFSKEVAKRRGVKEHVIKPRKRVRIYFRGSFNERYDLFEYEEPRRYSTDDGPKWKKKIIDFLGQAGEQDLEFFGEYLCDDWVSRRGKRIGHTSHKDKLAFGFQIDEEKRILWWSGRANWPRIKGEYIRTQESLKNVAVGLAEALEEGFYIDRSSSSPFGLGD